MPIWRLVFDKVATLQEIENHWSLDDVMRAMSLLDFRADIQSENAKKGRK
jgi:hypothetical protein